MDLTKVYIPGKNRETKENGAREREVREEKFEDS